MDALKILKSANAGDTLTFHYSDGTFGSVYIHSRTGFRGRTGYTELVFSKESKDGEKATVKFSKSLPEFLETVEKSATSSKPGRKVGSKNTVKQETQETGAGSVMTELFALRAEVKRLTRENILARDSAARFERLYKEALTGTTSLQSLEINQE